MFFNDSSGDLTAARDLFPAWHVVPKNDVVFVSE
jgi:hypothetical protein